MIQGKTFKDKYYCSSPFNSIFIDTHGGVASCCAGKYVYGNLKEATLEELVNSPTAKALRNNVSNGICDSYCSRCVREEDYAGHSQRNHFDGIDIDVSKDFELKTLDLRWSSLCNFSCVYCDERFSSSWAKKKGLGLVKENLDNQDSIFDFIEKQSSTIEKIMLAGGEPLLQMQNDKLLDIIPKETQITIISNLGLDLQKSNIFKKLSKMPNILWAISMENIGEQFEYVRQGGMWDRMLSNIKYIKENTYHDINFLSICNVLSLSQLHDFLLFADSREIRIPVMWQSIEGVDGVLHAENFSSNVKKYLIDKIENLPYLEKPQNLQIDYLKQFVNKLKQPNKSEPIDLKFREFVKNQESKYSTHKKTFSELWPELDSIIQNNQ